MPAFSLRRCPSALLGICSSDRCLNTQNLSSAMPACAQMVAAQFDGLPRLARLHELDVSGTGFDDACCAHLEALPDLTDLK